MYGGKTFTTFLVRGGFTYRLWGMHYNLSLLELRGTDPGVNDMWFAVLIIPMAVTALSACATLPASEQLPQAATNRSEPMAGQSAAVLSLQRQVRERDRRIAELTFQLEALKTIEQEAEFRRRQGRFPATRDR